MRPCAARLALAFLLGLLVPYAGADELKEAARLVKAGEHAQALERVNRVLAARPRDAQARFLKGIILTEQGQSREATEIFLRLTQDHPELPEPYNNLAVIYASQGQYDKARAALEQAIRTHPAYATAYENLGDVYAKLASQAYDKALQLDSTNAGAQQKLALVRELVGPPRAPAAASKEPATGPAAAAGGVAKAAPPAPKAPAETAPPASARANAEEEVVAAVRAWARAWSAKDADAYLAFYAPEFRPAGGESRSQWEKTRRERIAAPKQIAVAVEKPAVVVRGEQATVTFRQNYRSDIVKTTSTKTLVLARTNGRWLIREEKVN